MSDIDLTNLTVARAARLIHTGELSPVELTDAYLERIERLDPTIGAYITVTPERARADARRAAEELATGHDRGPLHGIPIGLKDLFDTAGVRTTGGTNLWTNRVPNQDSAVARKLREAGTVLLGKLNLDEVAAGAGTENPHYGTTHNPWDLTRIAGGSSGGSAAAIAASLALATMGSDTGGSVRWPAALCGVVGLKPTYGRVSPAGAVALAWTFDHAGPITRTVEDAALLLVAIAGYDPNDFSTVPVPVEDYASKLSQGLAGLRVGVARAYFFERLDDEVRLAVEQALTVLRELGALVHDVDLGWKAEHSAAWSTIARAEAKHYHDEILPNQPDDHPEGVGWIRAWEMPSGADLVAAFRHQRDAIEAQRQVLSAVDVVVLPTAPLPAPLIGQSKVAYGGIEEGRNVAALRCGMPFNVSGLPALSAPCGFTQAGLPIGLQIVGRTFDEATVLRVGHQYEQVTEWHRRRPPL
jgi:aspartyl-tRNA(Asn)/glutamyl-tRNA(Gln) amidotransferase subunit A